MSLHETIEFCRNKVSVDGRKHALYERCFNDGALEIRLRDTIEGTDGMTVLIGDTPVIMENKNGRIIRLDGTWTAIESYRQFGRLPKIE